jgi:hypothetical protein
MTVQSFLQKTLPGIVIGIVVAVATSSFNSWQEGRRQVSTQRELGQFFCTELPKAATSERERYAKYMPLVEDAKLGGDIKQKDSFHDLAYPPPNASDDSVLANVPLSHITLLSDGTKQSAVLDFYIAVHGVQVKFNQLILSIYSDPKGTRLSGDAKEYESLLSAVSATEANALSKLGC